MLTLFPRLTAAYHSAYPERTAESADRFESLENLGTQLPEAISAPAAFFVWTAR